MPTASNETEALSRTVACLYQFALDPAAWLDQQAQWLALTDEFDPLELEAALLAPHLDAIESLAQDAAPLKQERRPPLGVLHMDGNGRVVSANAQARAVLQPLNVSLASGEHPAWPGPEGSESISAYLADVDRGGETVIVPFRSLGKIVLGLLSRSRLIADRLSAEALPNTARYSLLLPGLSFTDESLGWLRARGLTETESTVALRIGGGLSPQEVAADMGTSINTVRSHVRAIFDKLGVNRQGELIKAVSDLAAIGQWLDRELAADVAAGERPLTGATMMLPRQAHMLPDGRVMSYRVYGDPAGSPVLSWHSGWGHTLLLSDQHTMLERAGIAYIAVERPGFGGSDRCTPYSAEGVAQDVEHLLVTLKIDRCAFVSSASGVRFALRTALHLADSGVEVSVVMGLAPRKGKPSLAGPESNNPFVRHYMRMARSPSLVESFVRLVALPSRRFVWRRFVRMAFGVGLDNIDPETRAIVHDHAVASAIDATCKSTYGISDELSYLVGQTEVPIETLRCPLIAWRGDQDDLSDRQELERYLSTAPDGRLQSVAGAGTLIEFSHFDRVIDQLEGYLEPRNAPSRSEVDESDIA